MLDAPKDNRQSDNDALAPFPPKKGRQLNTKTEEKLTV